MAAGNATLAPLVIINYKYKIIICIEKEIV